jgi:hypothetical protein
MGVNGPQHKTVWETGNGKKQVNKNFMRKMSASIVLFFKVDVNPLRKSNL